MARFRELREGDAGVVLDAGGVAEELTEGDRRPGRREVGFGEDMAECIAGSELAILLQQQNGRRGELLADRADVEASAGCE